MARLGFCISLLATSLVVVLSAPALAIDSLKVMSFNVWSADDSSQGQAGIVSAVQAGQADIVGFQEMNAGAGATVASTLGMNYDPGSQIASRFKIVDTSLDDGVKLELAPGIEAYAFNVHLAYYPYGPYQLAGIPYQGGALYDPNTPNDIAAVVQDQENARGGQIAAVLDEMQPALASGLPVFLTGDFNEASHLDWTASAAAAGVHSAVVPWPTSTKVANAGLTDSYRQVHYDETTTPGNTWSAIYGPDYENNVDGQIILEPQDRIDFVYYAGSEVSAVSANTIGPDDGISGIGIASGYPSDHRSVVTSFDVSGDCFILGDFDGNCLLDASDWAQFRTGQQTDMSGLTSAQAYDRGDLNGDFLNNYADFSLFKKEYEQVNGIGSFSAMVANVPEPTSLLLAITFAGLFLTKRNNLSVRRPQT